MKVSDFQQVHKADFLVELEDSDYLAQVAQATAAVEAAKAAIENNRRQRELQDARIERKNRINALLQRLAQANTVEADEKYTVPATDKCKKTPSDKAKA